MSWPRTNASRISPFGERQPTLLRRCSPGHQNLCFAEKATLQISFSAPLSQISNNIAEGFERGSTKELLQYLYIARGSAGEVRSMLCVMQRMDSFSELENEINNLKGLVENISRQIHGWATSMQNSDIKGDKFLNEKTKLRYDRKQRREEFLKQQSDARIQLEARLKRQATEREENRES